MQQNYEDRIERSDSTSDELSGRIEFANFISDIRNINLDDVPIITDQLAPVEMLLNPITSEPYNVGDRSQQTNELTLFQFKVTLSHLYYLLCS